MGLMAASIDSACAIIADRVDVLDQRVGSDSQMRNQDIAALSAVVMDTGWRSIPFSEGVLAVAHHVGGRGNFLHVRRVGNGVFLRGFLQVSSAPAGSVIADIPVGFQAGDVEGAGSWSWPGGLVQYTPASQRLFGLGMGDAGVWLSGGVGFALSWVADDAFPDLEALPGERVTDAFSPVAGATPLKLSEVNRQLLEEKTVRAKADTAIGDRATRLEQRVSSLEPDVRSLGASTDRRLLHDAVFTQRVLARLARCQTERVNIVCLGSSSMEGYLASSARYSFTGHIATALYAAYPLNNGGVHYETSNLEAAPNDGVNLPGLCLVNGAKGGTQAHDYVTDAKVSAIAKLRPAVILHMVGSNDYLKSKNPKFYREELQQAIAKIDNAYPDANHVLIHQNPRLDVSSGVRAWAEYGEQMKAIADGSHITFVDLSKPFVDLGVSPNDTKGLYDADKIHMNDAGYQLLANSFLDAAGVQAKRQMTEYFALPTLGGGVRWKGNSRLHWQVVDGVLHFTGGVEGAGGGQITQDQWNIALMPEQVRPWYELNFPVYSGGYRIGGVRVDRDGNVSVFRAAGDASLNYADFAGVSYPVRRVGSFRAGGV